MCRQVSGMVNESFGTHVLWGEETQLLPLNIWSVVISKNTNFFVAAKDITKTVSGSPEEADIKSLMEKCLSATCSGSPFWKVRILLRPLVALGFCHMWYCLIVNIGCVKLSVDMTLILEIFPTDLDFVKVSVMHIQVILIECFWGRQGWGGITCFS